MPFGRLRNHQVLDEISGTLGVSREQMEFSRRHSQLHTLLCPPDEPDLDVEHLEHSFSPEHEKFVVYY